MSVVSLKRDWFDPEGKLWSARNNPHEMDEALVAQLPSDAVVDGDDPKAEGKKGKKELKESQEAALDGKEKELELLQKAESEHNAKSHAASMHKSATPPKL